jgi:hypothetical protein
MQTATGVTCVRRLGVLALMVMTLPVTAGAQAPTANVEVDPVTCWWRAGVSSVRVGETFPVQLTCSALETEAVRAVIDRARMGPAAVQFPPYEVVGGSQSADHVTAGRRFMQYDYMLRLIAEEAFGRDVPITGMEVTYRIESRVERDAAVQGREQTYQLPPIPMRISSLVPEDARSIREPAVPSFAAIAAREFRARMFRLVALILLGVAALMLAVATLRWFRQGRTAAVQADRPILSNRAVLAAVRRDLRVIQNETRADGWTAATVGRTLAAARVVTSYLTGRPIVQRRLDGAAADGELVVGRRWPSPRRVAFSGSATAHEPGETAAALAATNLDSALRRLTSARYGRSPSLESPPLDDALASVISAADNVASKHTWIAEAIASLRQSMRAWRPRAWAR